MKKNGERNIQLNNSSELIPNISVSTSVADNLLPFANNGTIANTLPASPDFAPFTVGSPCPSVTSMDSSQSDVPAFFPTRYE